MTKPAKMPSGRKASTKSLEGESRQEPQATGWIQDVSGEWFEAAIKPERPTHVENPDTQRPRGERRRRTTNTTTEDNKTGKDNTKGRDITGNGEVPLAGGEMTPDKTMPKESGGKTSGKMALVPQKFDFIYHNFHNQFYVGRRRGR